MIKLKGEKLTKSFDGVTIVKDVDIHIQQGEIVSLLGVSGSGKTTLFNMLSGLISPDSGKVYLEAEEITGKPGMVSYMLQKDLLFDHKKIIDNVALPMVLRGENKKTARQKANDYFEKFGLEGTQEQYPAQLSGGMRQRVALLRTYLSSNGVALLDEPFSALDAITKSSVHRWYLDVMENIDLATLLITHDIDEAILLSNRIYILGDKPGRIVKEIVIEESHPRQNDFNLTQKFLEYKKVIVNALGQ